MQSGDSRADNLFSRLFPYRPSTGRMSLEDYCTEALAWCLSQSEEFAQGFLALTGIEELRKYRGPVAVATQQSFRGSEDEDEEEESRSPRGRFDLVIRPAQGNEFALVVESKVWSDLHDSQLKRYRDELDKGPRFNHVAGDRRFLVALTDHAEDQPLDQAHGRLRWSEVCKLLEKLSAVPIADPGLQTKANLTSIYQQFAVFLKEKGMSLELTTINSDIKPYLAGLRFREQLEAVLRAVRSRNRNLQEALRNHAVVNHDPSFGELHLGLWSPSRHPPLHVGFQLIKNGEIKYLMTAGTWGLSRPETRAGLKEDLQVKYPGLVVEYEQVGWIKVEQPVFAEHDGAPEKMIEWFGSAATEMIKLRAAREAAKNTT
jgi:hypothetical protein